MVKVEAPRVPAASERKLRSGSFENFLSPIYMRDDESGKRENIIEVLE